MYSINDWIEVQELREEDLTLSEFILEVAYIFDPDFDDNISASELRELRKKYAFTLKDVPATSNVKPFEFKTIKFGKFIDLDTYLVKFKLHEKIYEICAVLFPDVDVEELEVSDALSAVRSFVSWRESIITKYQGIFNTVDEDEDDEDYEDEDEPIETEEDKWGWLAVVYNLCGGDMTKTDIILDKSFISVLNWASMRKDFESRQQKPTV